MREWIVMARIHSRVLFCAPQRRFAPQWGGKSSFYPGDFDFLFFSVINLLCSEFDPVLLFLLQVASVYGIYCELVWTWLTMTVFAHVGVVFQQGVNSHCVHDVLIVATSNVLFKSIPLSCNERKLCRAKRFDPIMFLIFPNQINRLLLSFHHTL